jgi:DNA-binding transcriptional LysR family regulator
MVDLVALRALIAVRDHGTVVGAAAALGFTPSAVSQQIKRLERRSATALLERVGRSVILTERGRLLAERGTRLLADLEQVELATTDAGEPTGTLRLAAFSTACRGLVAPLLRRLRTTAPGLSVTVTETDPREAVATVARGGADLAVVHDWRGMPLDVPASLVGRHVLTDVADVLLPAGHPLAGTSSVAARDLGGEPWVSTHPGSICHEWLKRMFGLHGITPDIRYVDSSFSTHVELVAQGVAVALLPRLGRDGLPPGVCALPVTDPTPSRDVRVLWRGASNGSTALLHVLDQLDQLDPAR